MNDSKLIYLFDAYFNKTATPSEQDELMELLEKSAYDDHLKGLLAATWASLDKKRLHTEWKPQNDMLTNILHKEQEIGGSKKMPPVRKILLPAAAVLLLLITIISYLLFAAISVRKQPLSNITERKLPDHIVPGSNRATLILGDGTRVTLDSLHAGPLAKQGNARLINLSSSTLAYKAAEEVSEATVFNTLSTNTGGQYQLLLSDGTRVWLNASSSIRYPTAFTGKERRVRITGEAYFEVEKNASMPFVVDVQGTEIRVLGTHFNIMSYADESTMNTTLLEGAVKVVSGETERTLWPGQESMINSGGNIKVAEADIEEVMAWKNGWFQFNASAIEKIMRQIARWYNVEVVYDGPIPAGHFTGMVSRENDIKQVLEIMQAAGVKFSINGRKVTVHI